MTRIVLLVQRPFHLNEDESEQWLRSQAGELARIDGVRRVDITRLASVSLQFGREWDWLVELYLAPGAEPQRALLDPVYVGLFADLRVLGMRPSVAVLGETLTLQRPA